MQAEETTRRGPRRRFPAQRYARHLRIPAEVALLVTRDARHQKELHPEWRYSENDIISRIIEQHYGYERQDSHSA